MLAAVASLGGEAARQISTIGRYAVFGEIAQGGMATVHYGRLIGAAGFARTVAIKRLHAQYARDAHFVGGFVDEARLAARIRHPNVVATIDVEVENGELAVVMEYIAGESLAKLVRISRETLRAVPVPIATGI